jgi:hypothetical protein
MQVFFSRANDLGVIIDHLLAVSYAEMEIRLIFGH